MANLNILAQLANEHRIGEHELGKETVLVFANNKLSNKAGTVQLPTHLKDRFMPLEAEANLDDALEYMMSVNANHSIISFLRSFPQRLAEFDARLDACPSPRSWMRASSLMDMDWPEGTNAELMACIAGTVGNGAANDFRVHMELHDQMMDPNLCIADPHNADLPENVNVSYILCAALAALATEKNVGDILTYGKRMDQYADHVVFMVKDMLTRTGGKKSPLLNSADMKKYLQTEGKELVL